MRRVMHRPPCWTETPAGRIRFIHEVRGCDLPVRAIATDRQHRGGFAVEVHVKPPGVPVRRVRIYFHRGGEVPTVRVDGPTESPHRYEDGSLCMWYPDDPPDRRWVHRHGARALLGHIAAHLVREEWWRRTGEWAGEEAPHA